MTSSRHVQSCSRLQRPIGLVIRCTSGTEAKTRDRTIRRILDIRKTDVVL